MDKFDLAEILTQYGVDQEAAERLKGEIGGSDLMNLVTLLKNNGRGVQLNKAAIILGKYGVKLGSKKNMSNNYLGAKFESLRGGRALDETFGVMKPLGEGFSYALEVSEQTRDRVLDWLDENQVEYQATSPVNYRIECGDRDAAYRTGRALSEILSKPTVRDSVEIEEKMSKNPNKRVNDAKAKMAKITPKDPNLKAATFRSGAGAHDGGKDPRKVDRMGRDAKHKPRFEEIEEPITEGVMGMTKLNPLFRLRELAGLPLRNMVDEDDFSNIDVPDMPADTGPLGAGPVDTGADMDMDVDGMGDDPVADPMADMDGGMDAEMDPDMAGPGDEMGDLAADDIGMDEPDMGADLGMDDLDAGVPGDLPPNPVEPIAGMGAGMPGAPTVPTQSDAMNQIEDSLNSIQTGLADIRLSEYKSLIQKLQDLTNQAQMMGRDYLGEARRKK